MNRTFASLLISLQVFSLGLASTLFAESQESPLVGRWSAKDSTGAFGTVIFEADGSADLIKDGVSLRETLERVQGSVTYAYDPSSEPAKLDFITIREGGDRQIALGIVTFLKKDSIKVMFSYDGKRPEKFDDRSQDTLVLHRDAVNMKKEPNQPPQTTPVSAPR